MRTALVLLSLAWIGGTALAEVGPSVPVGGKLSVAAQQDAQAMGRKGRRHGMAVVKHEAAVTDRDALSSCVALWEPATHMNRSEWSRACHRVAERLKTMTLR